MPRIDEHPNGEGLDAADDVLVKAGIRSTQQVVMDKPIGTFGMVGFLITALSCLGCEVLELREQLAAARAERDQIADAMDDEDLETDAEGTGVGEVPGA
jgi:hypothetical protein